MYAELVGFLTEHDHIKSNSEVPAKTYLPDDSILVGGVKQGIRDKEFRKMDIYTQEFFLLAYSKLMNDKSIFFESQEGHTFVK